MAYHPGQHRDRIGAAAIGAVDIDPLGRRPSADHGLAVGHHGLMGKQNLYEHSTRVPFMVVGPGVPKNASIDTPIYLQDVMPTTLELAGIAKPDHVDFTSLMPLIKGQKTTPYDAVYGAYLGVNRSVTYQGYKLLMYPKVPKARLFNLKDDPDEMIDLADDPKYKATMKKLFAKFLELQKETGDTMDLKKTFPKL